MLMLGFMGTKNKGAGNYQEYLPPLPVPPLKVTMKKYAIIKYSCLLYGPQRSYRACYIDTTICCHSIIDASIWPCI